jgi:hypothetical protein
MKLVLTIILAFGFSYAQNASARLTCSELDELSEILDDLSYNFDKMHERSIDNEVDNALGELTDALKDVAAEENDRRLTAWINDLEIAWEDMEKDDFVESLDDITERLDELYDRDCERY